MRAQSMRIWRKSMQSMLFLPTFTLLLILFADLLLIPGFFHLEIKGGHLYGNVIDILVHGSPTMILAMGMTLVIATGGVDLSTGAVMAIASSSAALLINPTIVGMNLTDPQLYINNPQYTWMPLWLVMIVPLIVGIGCGLWNGMLVAYWRIQPMVATLVLMIAGRGIAQLLTNAIQIIIFNDTFAFIGQGFIFLPFSLYIAAVVFVGAWLITNRTSIGLFVESVGINSRSSFYAGIGEKRIKLFAYTLGGLCSGIAGLVVASNIRTSDANNIGLNSELDAILAVVIGGTLLGTGGRFSLAGSAIGALVIQTIVTSMYAFGVSSSEVSSVKALVIIAVIFVYAEQTQAFIRRLVGATATVEA